jgi:hypothetical protein
MKTIPIYPAKDPIKLKINLENMPHTVYRRVLVPEDQYVTTTLYCTDRNGMGVCPPFPVS